MIRIIDYSWRYHASNTVACRRVSKVWSWSKTEEAGTAIKMIGRAGVSEQGASCLFGIGTDSAAKVPDREGIVIWSWIESREVSLYPPFSDVASLAEDSPKVATLSMHIPYADTRTSLALACQ